jgi:uncharacterized protein (TIGR03083 family)
MANVLPMVHAERRSLAGFLDTLTPQQWATPSWCDKWNVQEVVGHIAAAGNVTVPHFFLGIVKAGFNFNKFVETDVERFGAGTPEQTRARFDAIIESNATPPAPNSGCVALGEVMVHGEDILRPLGLRGEHPAEHLVALAEFYKTAGPPLGAKKRIVGLKLRATDVGWSHGEGPEVAGPCMSLILAMVGRAGALADCSGDGVEALRSRS